MDSRAGQDQCGGPPAARTSRRALLQRSGISLLALGVGPEFLDRLVLAQPPGDRVLVTIFQRGAMDGLMAVSPLDDPRLRELRQNLHLPRSRQDRPPTQLDEQFWLHPGFDRLLPMWGVGDLAIVHGVGSPNPTRSHFDAQDHLECGNPYRKSGTGWLNRAASKVTTKSALGAVGIARALPRSLEGPEAAVAIGDLETFALRGSPRWAPNSRFLRKVWQEKTVDALGDVGADLFEALDLLSPAEVGSYRRSRVQLYPNTGLGKSLMQIAFLIKAGVGLRVATADSNGWDTHYRQGALEGTFDSRARDLAGSLAAFWEDLGDHRDRVLVLTMTEFGRSVVQNGSGGTDHGRGSCFFVLGSSVEGRVHGQIPTLERDALFEGRDLPVGVDFRSVLSGVAADWLGAQQLFPGWEGPDLRLIWA